ncbi:hypothetical protein D9Q98_001590 [Chlorella vulgaris]|uniref:Acyl carrier protein n=1 Tax=Chlorella vulgaris TaxID=3077 RepID=A0A9D4YZH6_CHLVU|nr:hypothetical protein D9Q98_001590 [Chlorella vulgaris]
MALIRSLRAAVLSSLRVPISSVQQQAAALQFWRGYAADASYLDKSEVTDRVLNVVKNFEKVEQGKVSPTAAFQKDLGLDSLDTVELVMALEEEFAIEIPDSEADKIQSCGDAIGYIAANPMAKAHRLHAVADQEEEDGTLQPSSTKHQQQPRVRYDAPRPAVDPDLLSALEMATDEELQDVYRTLHGRSVFSPLLKSMTLLMEQGGEAHLGGRDALIMAIDRKLRFLAADPGSTLRGRWPAYRQVLLMIRDKLSIACPSTLRTHELEAEVFLHLLKEHADALGPSAAPGSQAAAAAEFAGQGDGGAAGGAFSQEPPTLVQRLLAPLRLGQEEVMPAVTRLGSALAISNVQQALVRTLGLNVWKSHVRYEAALNIALSAGRAGVQGSLQGKVAVQAAKEGITAAVGRYAAARSLLSVLGPLVWASTAFELLSVSMGTDWSRVVKATFCIAQIRLLRTYGWSQGAGFSNVGDVGR